VWLIPKSCLKIVESSQANSVNGLSGQNAGNQEIITQMICLAGFAGRRREIIISMIRLAIDPERMSH
jgi:hypothetical protein